MSTLQLFNVLLLDLFCALLCASLAQKKGKHPLIWGIIGFSLSIFGIILFLLQDYFDRKKAKKIKVLEKKQSLEPPPVEDFWYYVDSGCHKIGPVKLRDLENAWEKSNINENSYIWKNGMPEWKKIKEIPEVSKDLAKR